MIRFLLCRAATTFTDLGIVFNFWGLVIQQNTSDQAPGEKKILDVEHGSYAVGVSIANQSHMS